MKHIKYLISFLLIFSLTVNECSISSQFNSANYHQVSHVNTKNELSHKHSESYIYGRKLLSGKIFVALNPYRSLRDVYSTQIQAILKLQTELYQTINSMIVHHVFLNKINTSSTLIQAYT